MDMRQFLGAVCTTMEQQFSRSLRAQDRDLESFFSFESNALPPLIQSILPLHPSIFRILLLSLRRASLVPYCCCLVLCAWPATGLLPATATAQPCALCVVVVGPSLSPAQHDASTPVPHQ
jgi:hypothetical protein